MMPLLFDRIKHVRRLTFEGFKILVHWLVILPVRQLRRLWLFLFHLPRTTRQSLRSWHRQLVHRPLVHIRWVWRKSNRAVRGASRSVGGLVQQWVVRPARWGYHGVLALWRFTRQAGQAVRDFNWRWLSDLRWMDRPLLRTRWMLRNLNRRTRGTIQATRAFFSRWLIRPAVQLVQFPFTASHNLHQTFQTLWKSTIRTLRQVTGWTVLVIGAIAAPMPIPVGLPLIIVGILIIGPRDPRIRWMQVRLRMLLRSWSRRRLPFISPAARKAFQFGNRLGRLLWRKENEKKLKIKS